MPSSMVVILVSTFPYHNGGGNMGDQGHEERKKNQEEENVTMKLWQTLDSTIFSGQTMNQSGRKLEREKWRLLRKKRPLEMGEERVELTCKRKKDLGHSG